MFGLGTKKMLNIMILKILERYSDEHRPLTQKRILELLDIEYGMKCDRRSVKSNLISLKEMGYDINIRNGVYIRRDFEDAELRMLIDNVLFSKTLSQSQSKRLIEKLKNLGSNQFSAKVNHICNLPELPHSDNTQVMFNLDTLNIAPERGCIINDFVCYLHNFRRRIVSDNVRTVASMKICIGSAFDFYVSDVPRNCVTGIKKRIRTARLAISSLNGNACCYFFVIRYKCNRFRVSKPCLKL